MASEETPEEAIARIAGLLTTPGIPYLLTGSLQADHEGLQL
jgi:hypothetical protein